MRSAVRAERKRRADAPEVLRAAPTALVSPAGDQIAAEAEPSRASVTRLLEPQSSRSAASSCARRDARAQGDRCERERRLDRPHGRQRVCDGSSDAGRVDGRRRLGESPGAGAAAGGRRQAQASQPEAVPRSRPAPSARPAGRPAARPAAQRAGRRLRNRALDDGRRRQRAPGSPPERARAPAPGAGAGAGAGAGGASTGRNASGSR